jgi:hypothetical protein
MRRKGPWSTERIERFLEDSTPRLADFVLARVEHETAIVEHETAIAIEPQTLVSWDYRERMGDAA